MNIEREKIESEETPEEAIAWERRMEAIVQKARNDPRFEHLFDAKEEAASEARARADIAAERVYSNEEVVAWLRTWGTPDRKPFPHRWPR